MAKQVINIGRTANDRSGDPLRTAFEKVNANFTELYSATGVVSQLVNGSKTVVLSNTGIITLPSSSYLESTDTNLKIGAQGTVTIRSNAASNLTTKEWTFDTAGQLVPGGDNLQDIGTPLNRVRHIYVGPGSVTIGNSILSESATGKLLVPGLTRATGYHAGEIQDTGDQIYSFSNNPVVIDNTYYSVLDGQYSPNASYVEAEYSVDQLDGEGFIDGISVVSPGSGWSQVEADSAKNNEMWAYIGVESNPFASFINTDWIQIPFVVYPRASDTEYEFSTGGGSTLVQRTVNYPAGESGDTAGTLALDPQGNVYVCIADYQQNEGQGYTVVTSEGYNRGQSQGGTLMSVVIALGDYPAIDAILQAASLPLTGWRVSGNVTDGYIRDCIAEQWTGDRWGFTWTYVPGQDADGYSQGEEFELTYTASQAAIWEQLSTGNSNIVTDRLVNGNSEVVLDSNGDLTTPGNVIIGGANVNNETHLVIDGANYWTSIQWKNFPAQQTTAAPFECQSQLLRVFRGENGISGHEELVAVTANTDNGDENALMITTSKGKIPDAPYNDGVGVQHNFIFGGDGKMQFPDGTKQETAYVPRNANLDGGGASVHYEIDTAFVDGGFSSSRHGYADPMFDGGTVGTENNLYNLDGGRA